MIIDFPPNVVFEKSACERTHNFFELMEYAAGFTQADELMADIVRQGIIVDTTATESGRTAVSYAVKYPNTLDALIAAKANVEIGDREGVTPLMHAIHERNNITAIQKLLAAGASVHTQDDRGYTALLHAVDRGILDAVKILCAAGAKMEEIHVGDTPVHLAAYISDPAILSYFLESGANPNVLNKHHRTPLYTALLKCRREAVDKLLAAGANVEHQDIWSRSPLLDVACDMDAPPEMCIKLLKRGANVYVRDQNGKSVIDYIAEQSTKYEAYGIMPMIERARCAYAKFVKTRQPPVVPKEVYMLLSATPLIDPTAPVDYVGNLCSIFRHAEWVSPSHPKQILAKMQEQGAITAETTSLILSHTFPRKRINVLPPRDGWER